MSELVNRDIPAGVRRHLRKEAFFGCAKCGSPILEYHHIIPFAELAHHDPDHMIALCPTCHQSLGKMQSKRCYELKENPRNKREGIIRGELGTDVDTTAFLVGSNTYINTPAIFSYYETPIIRYSIEHGQALLDIYIPKEDMWPDILVKGNDLIVNSGDKWDIEFRTNFLRIQKKQGNTYFQIDLRKEVAKINGQFSILGQQFTFSPTSTNIGNGNIKNCRFSDCSGGISIGDSIHKMHWPNYGMARPEATFVPYR